MQALRQAQFASARADEIGQAQRLIRQLMRTPTDGYAPLAGATPAFDWRVEIQPTGADLPVSVCRRAVSVAARRTHRTYAAATQEVCPLEAADA